MKTERVDKFDVVAPRLAAQGYDPVPIIAGQKRPAVPKWQEGGFAATADKYRRDYTGILTRHTPAIDIDTSDEKLVQQIEAVVLDVLDCHRRPPPKRIGLPPRMLLLFRTEEPFEKLATADYELPTDPVIGGKPKRSKVEILASGQQFVAYAIHPNTGKPYRWNGSGEPLTVTRAELPVLDWAQAVEIVKRADALLAKHGRCVGGATVAQHDGARKPNDKLLADDPQELRAALAAIPNNGMHFDEWLAMLFATKGALGDEGLGAFLAWSAKSEKHDEGVTRQEWHKARPTRRGAGSIYWTAEQHGWTRSSPKPEQRREQQRQRAQDIGDGIAGNAPLTEIMSLSEMLENLVFVSDGSRVARRDHPHIALPLNEFKVHTRASETQIGKKLVPTADLWVSDPLRVTTHTITFRPGHGEFTFDPEGAPALNLWRERQRSASSGSIEPFLHHVAYLVPDETERGRFLDWLAHTEQFPGVLPHTHYLMVAHQTGIGRNWLASLLARVWAGSTRLGFDLVGAMQSGFNGALSRRLLVIVDELKAADTGYGAANHAQQLKAMLTTEHRAINPKFGRQHVEFNCARWLMLSQHFDALPLERNDRRVIVISNPTERRAPDYYAKLYAMLDDAAFINAVGAWLAARDIKGFNPSEPAPLTAAKVKAIDACVSDLERALIELRDGTDALAMTATQIGEYLFDCGVKVTPGRTLSAAYAAVGLVPCEKLVLLRGKRHRVVALRDTARLKSAQAYELVELLGAHP